MCITAVFYTFAAKIVSRRCYGIISDMINRTIVRTRIVQILFAYYSDGGKTTTSAQKELNNSFVDTYKLYFLLLDFVDELTRYVDERQGELAERAKVMHQDYNPNPRFVNNRFARQLFENRTLRHYLDEYGLSWDAAHTYATEVYKQLQEEAFFSEYMSSQETSYEADKAVWRKIFTFVMADSEALENALDELEVALDAKNWTTDMNVVISYIIKTIKRFKEDNGADQPLLEMFDHEEELDFAKKLLQTTIEHSDEYEKLIADRLKNWEADRIAFMDMIILKVAMAEILTFPDIAVQVSLNEYIELAKEYSTDGSPQFVNGVLDQLVQDFKKENKIFK